MTGVSICAGERVEVVPIVEGYGFPHAAQSLPVGGREVTAALLSSLSTHAQLSPERDFEAVNTLKERVCFVAPDMQREAKVGHILAQSCRCENLML